LLNVFFDRTNHILLLMPIILVLLKSLNYPRFYSCIASSFLALILQSNGVLAETKTTSKIKTKHSQFQAENLLPVIVIKDNWLTSQKQNQTNSSSSEASPNQQSTYKTPPQVVPSKNVAPITTLIFLNPKRAVNHLTDWEFSGRYLFSDDRSENLKINSIVKLNSQVVQSLSQENVFRSDFQADYFELKTVKQERTITTTFKEPQTLNGLIIQQTFTGNCSAVDPEVTDQSQQCSFLPAIVTDRESIEPDFLVPTNIEQFNQGNPIAQPISQETLEIIKQPGFQNIGADGEPLGLDIFFPNTGGVPGNPQSKKTKVSREEDIDLTYSGRYYKTRQVIKANHERAVLGRTVHGFGLIGSQNNLLLNGTVQGIGLFLPDIIPELEGSKKAVNTNINKNLFVAANNTRLPEDSFVIYQGGLGSSQSPKKTKNNQKAPSANFNSIWLGLSPVVEPSLETSARFEPTSPRRITLRTGAQGGGDSNLEFSAIVDDTEVTTNNPQLTNFFIQNFTTFLEQDANFITKRKFVEETNYYPHLSLSGNITGNDRALRYYGGIIASEEAKVYLGSDYTQKFNNGWQVNIAAINYTNPDEDYFSKAEGNVAKAWRFSKETSLTVSAGFRYVWNRPEEQVLDDPVDNNVNLGATLNMDWFSLSLTRLFDVFPNSAGNQLRASVGIDVSNNTTVNAYFIPQRGVESFGISGNYQFTNDSIFNSLSVRWNRSVFDFGEDPFDNELKESNDTFSVLLNFSGS
ncbi:MAG: hypothetical protein ABEI32_08990, partial [Halothece sp.]